MKSIVDIFSIMDLDLIYKSFWVRYKQNCQTLKNCEALLTSCISQNLQTVFIILQPNL